MPAAGRLPEGAAAFGAAATGTAVGGGTLQGLGQLLLGTSQPQEIDRLALGGDAAAVNITLGEAVGGALGMLPAQAAAVNFGKAARRNETAYRRDDVAAGLVALVAQEIGIIAAMASRVEGISPVVVLGRLVDLLSIRQNLQMVADIYQTRILIPPNPGQGTVTGALQAAGKN